LTPSTVLIAISWSLPGSISGNPNKPGLEIRITDGLQMLYNTVRAAAAIGNEFRNYLSIKTAIRKGCIGLHIFYTAFPSGRLLRAACVARTCLSVQIICWAGCVSHAHIVLIYQKDVLTDVSSDLITIKNLV
jgi:hypothetical protein